MLAWPFQSDAAVLRRVRAGDHASFRVIVDRYVPVIRGVALAYLSNPHDADDVVQDTFLRAFEAREKLTQPTNLGAWLITVAKNRCFDLLRKRTRESGVPATGAEPAVTPAFEREELYRALWDHISKLDPAMREVLMLHYFSRKSAREIAALLEITPYAAAKRLQRARTSLGRRMVDQIGTELGVKMDRKQDTNRVMAILAVEIPGFSKATASGSVIAVGAALKFASIATVSLLICVAAFQLMHAKSFSAQSEAQAQLAAIDSPLLASVPSTAAAIKTAATSPPKDPVELLNHSESTSDAEGLVTGIVIDMFGKPVFGASIAIKRNDWPDERDGNSYAQTTTSDSNGRFTIDRFPLLGASTGNYGSYELSATKGNLFGACTVEDEPWLFDQFIEIAAYENFSISGTIRDESGSPVPQAVVIPDCNSFDVPITWRGRGGGSVQSDAQGNFLLANLMRGVYELRVSAFGFAPFQGAAVSAGSTGVDVVLEPMGNVLVSGRVIDSLGNPVKDASVTAYLPNDGRTQNVDRSGPDGAFSLRLSKGSYVVRLSDSDWALVAAARIVTVDDRVPPQPIDLVVADGATISGQVASASGVDHVFAKKVGANGEGSSGRVHDDGTYVIRGLSTGAYTITIGNGERFGKRELDIEIGNDYRVDFTPEPVWSVNGTVTDVNGNPAGGVRVLALNDKEISGTRARGNYISLHSGAITDERGRFSCARFDGDSVHVQAIAKSGITSVEGPFVPDDNRTAELRLIPASFVDGHIVPASEYSKRNAFLIAVPLNARVGTLFPNPNATGELIGMNALDAKLAGGFRTTAGLSGRFRFPSLPAGDYEIHAYTLGMTVAPNPEPLRVTVAPENPIRDLEVRLPKLGGGSIQGRLTLKGEPLRGQRLQVSPTFEEIKTFAYWSANTDENGEYRIDGIQPGRHRLSAFRHMATSGKKGIREISYNFDISEGEVHKFDLDLASGKSSLAGLVTGAGEPVPGATLSIRTDDGPGMSPEEVRAETDSRGRFAVEGLHPGEYNVSVLRYRDRGNPTDPFIQSFKVEIADQPQNIVEFEITAGGVSGTVNGIHNNEKTLVVLIPGDIEDREMSFERFRELKSKVAYETEVQPKGAYRLMNVDAGIYTAFAVSYPVTADYDEDTFAGLRYTSETIEVSPARTFIMDFDLE